MKKVSAVPKLPHNKELLWAISENTLQSSLTSISQPFYFCKCFFNYLHFFHIFRLLLTIVTFFSLRLRKSLNKFAQAKTVLTQQKLTGGIFVYTSIYKPKTARKTILFVCIYIWQIILNLHNKEPLKTTYFDTITHFCKLLHNFTKKLLLFAKSCVILVT